MVTEAVVLIRPSVPNNNNNNNGKHNLSRHNSQVAGLGLHRLATKNVAPKRTLSVGGTRNTGTKPAVVLRRPAFSRHREKTTPESARELRLQQK